MNTSTNTDLLWFFGTYIIVVLIQIIIIIKTNKKNEKNKL